MSTAPVQVPPSPMSLGDVFTATFSVFRRRIGAFLGITVLQQLVMLVAIVVPLVLSLIVMLPGLAVNSAPSQSTVVVAMLGIFGGFFLAVLIGGIVSLYFDGLMVVCANEALQGRFPTVAELRVLSKGYVGRIVGLYLLAMLAYLVSVTLVALPMIFSFVAFLAAALNDSSSSSATDTALALLGGLAVTVILLVVVLVGAFVITVKVAYVAQVCAVERLSGIAALRRAWGLTKGAFWRTFGYLFVFSLIAGAAQQVVSVAMNVFVPAVSSSTSSASSESAVLSMLRSGTFTLMVTAVAAVSLIIQLVIVPLRHTFVTAMYGDQVRRLQLGPVDHAFAMNVPGYGQQAYGYPQAGYGYPQPGQQPGYGPYGPATSPDPYGQAPQAQPPYGQQPGPGMYGQQPGPAPYAPPSAPGPYAPPSATGAHGQG